MTTPAIPQVRSIAHDYSPTDVWFDDCTENPAVAVEVKYPGKDHDEPIFIPASIAREVAQAILDALPE